jgi:hypothetical protein
MNTPRVPPRFVPTLTTVLEPLMPLVPSEPVTPTTSVTPVRVESAAEPVAGVSPASAESPPPPLLVTPTVPEQPATPAASDLRHGIALDPATRFSEMERFALEEQLLHRVLQRVDLQLEERLSDVVAAAVQAQLDLMVPRLRNEIEDVLRTLVTESLAQELQEKPGSNPPGNGHPLG